MGTNAKNRVDFERWIGHIFEAEGGHVDDPDDSGGETKYGISQQTYPHLDIASLTKKDAKSLYWRDYWLKVRAGEFPPSLQLTMFDMAVNQGVRSAVRVLQKALNTLIPGGWALVVDGVLGPKTMAMVHVISDTNASEEVVLDRLTLKRLERYKNIAMKKYKNRKFMTGWVRRTLDVYDASAPTGGRRER